MARILDSTSRRENVKKKRREQLRFAMDNVKLVNPNWTDKQVRARAKELLRPEWAELNKIRKNYLKAYLQKDEKKEKYWLEQAAIHRQKVLAVTGQGNWSNFEVVPADIRGS
jgi:hypothetical protein